MSMTKSGIQQAVDSMAAISGHENGGQTKLAEAIGVSPQAVQSWVDKGYAPVGRARQIARVSGIDHQLLVDPVIRDLFLTTTPASE